MTSYLDRRLQVLLVVYTFGFIDGTGPRFPRPEDLARLPLEYLIVDSESFWFPFKFLIHSNFFQFLHILEDLICFCQGISFVIIEDFCSLIPFVYFVKHDGFTALTDLVNWSDVAFAAQFTVILKK